MLYGQKKVSDLRDEYIGALDRGLTINAAAEILGYSRDTIMRMLKQGDLRAYGEGRRTRIYESSIEEYRHRTEFRNRTIRESQIPRASQRHRAAMERIRQLLE